MPADAAVDRGLGPRFVLDAKVVDRLARHPDCATELDRPKASLLELAVNRLTVDGEGQGHLGNGQGSALTAQDPFRSIRP